MTPPCGVPRATYRLQFHHDFTFRDATGLVDYLAELGVSHIYASPFLQARRGSTHGYDITDHNRLNPEIGSAEDFAALIEALHARGMGLVLDFVPNHMGIGPDNPWWLDVLEWGEASPYAGYFDIDWHAARRDMEGKVLLPVLGDQYGAVLESGAIVLRFDADEGSFSAWYYEHRFPIAPRDYAAILHRAAAGAKDERTRAGLTELAAAAAELASLSGGPGAARVMALQLKRALAENIVLHPALAAAAEGYAGRAEEPQSWRDLHALLEGQAYRIAYWRVASDEINYRRFFNINDLAGLRIELPELFETAHRLVLALIREGSVQGLRIDHVDGLFDPAFYCRRLQDHASGLAPDGAPFYILVEKILARYETLPDWPIAGTTGYEFANQVLGLFIDARSERRLTRFYQRISGRNESFDAVLWASKERIAAVNLASEVEVLSRAIHDIALADWRTRDFTLGSVRGALRDVLAAFPVYRTYVDEAGASAEDRRFIDWAVAVAKKRSPATDTSIYDFLHGILSGDLDGRSAARRGQILRLAMRFQQLSGPVMAKGFEDTALYRYVRFLAHNEVGGDPRRFSVSPAAFHRFAEERQRRWPQAMLATATHDTKRGEDARARLAVLSEIPGEWRRHVLLWLRLNRARRSEVDGEPAPSGEHEYLFYQIVLGAWPLELEPSDGEAMAGFAQRIVAAMIKSVREGKERSSWGNPDEAYETALTRFVESALDGSRPNPFLVDLAGLVRRVARLGAINSLAQTALKLTAPGIPDIYQGGELWDLSLVDPDNRRPVDFATRRRLFETLRRHHGEDGEGLLAALARDWRDGSEKLFLIWRVLALRAALPALFEGGDYVALAAEGAGRDHLCAFARRREDDAVVTALPRLVGRLYDEAQGVAWGDTALRLPADGRWTNILTGRQSRGDTIAAGTLFADFPVAVLRLTRHGDEL